MKNVPTGKMYDMKSLKMWHIADVMESIASTWGSSGPRCTLPQLELLHLGQQLRRVQHFAREVLTLDENRSCDTRHRRLRGVA